MQYVCFTASTMYIERYKSNTVVILAAYKYLRSKDFQQRYNNSVTIKKL